MWRRIQTSQQQAERQKKSLLQLCMMFHSRAEQIMKDMYFSNYIAFNIISPHCLLGISSIKNHQKLELEPAGMGIELFRA